MISLNFFTDFLYWVFNSLTHSQYFFFKQTQIAYFLAAKYGGRHVSSAWPTCVHRNYVQYTDGLTLYRSRKLKEKDTYINPCIFYKSRNYPQKHSDF